MARVSSSQVSDLEQPGGAGTALASDRRPHRSFLMIVLVSLRPEQWSKNLVVFAGLLFGGRLTDSPSILFAIATFAIFCALSGAVYLFNDVADREADQQHPLKRTRPIASGQLSRRTALLIAAFLGAAAIGAAVLVSPMVGLAGGGYLLLLLLYSAAFKDIVIIDALTIAGGFVLRAVAGALAVSVPISQWLLVCTTLLALFLAFSKRRHELTVLGEAAIGHRRILGEYTPYLLDQMVAVVTASTLIAYTVYATSPETAERLGTSRLGLTIPFVLYGIFRYLYLVHQKRGGGSPAVLLMTDRPLLACVTLWALSVALILYSPFGR
jgi:4-hydroxybenzoate polyprenyltransferase